MCTVLFYFNVLIHVNIHEDVESSGEEDSAHYFIN